MKFIGSFFVRFMFIVPFYNSLNETALKLTSCTFTEREVQINVTCSELLSLNKPIESKHFEGSVA